MGKAADIDARIAVKEHERGRYDFEFFSVFHHLQK